MVPDDVDSASERPREEEVVALWSPLKRLDSPPTVAFEYFTCIGIGFCGLRCDRPHCSLLRRKRSYSRQKLDLLIQIIITKKKEANLVTSTPELSSANQVCVT